MHKGRVRVWIALAVGAPTLVACTALLGTYEVDQPGTDAGGDAPAPPVDTGAPDVVVDTGAPDAATDTGTPDVVTDSGVVDAGPEGCQPNDPLDGPLALINELNDENFDDRSGRPTPDGKYLLFTRRALKDAADPSSNVYIAERVGGQWTGARTLNQLGGIDPDGGRTNEGSPMFVPGPTPRIVFGSDRRVPISGGGSFFSSFDFYYAIVNKNDFSDISSPVRLGETNPSTWNTGGLEGDSFLVPSANGGGRAFFSAFVTGNHSDVFYLDYDSTLTGTARQPVAAANLPTFTSDYSPVFANGFLYFTSGRVSLPDGGIKTLDSGTPDAAPLYDESVGRVWVSRQLTVNPPTFSAPVLVQDLSFATANTRVSWASPDGCSLIIASDRPGASGPPGTFHLYTARRKPK